MILTYIWNGTTRVISWELNGALAAGASITYTLITTVNGGATGPGACGPDLDNTVTAQWGCVPNGGTGDGIYNDDPDQGTCYIDSDPGIDTVERAVPELEGEITIQPDNLDACSDPNDLGVDIAMKITGTNAYWIDLVVELPEQITLDVNTDVVVTSSKYGTTDIWPDPNVTGTGGAGSPQTLTFYDITAPPASHNDYIPDPNSLPDTVSGGEINLAFGLDVGCFAGGPIKATLYFYDCCGVAYTKTVTQNMAVNTPVLEPTKTLAQEVDCRDEATWTVALENTSATDAEVVLLEDTLPDGLLYVAGSGNPAPVVNGQVLRWELPGSDVNGTGGWTATFKTTVDRTKIPNCADLTNRTNPVQATWGCVEDPNQVNYNDGVIN